MGFASVEEIETRAKEQECQLWETIPKKDKQSAKQHAKKSVNKHKQK